MRCDLSIIIPSVRVELLPACYDSISKSVGSYLYEVIVVGPLFPPKELEIYGNFRFIRDYGSPARCTQLGMSIAEGTFVTWGSDDCIWEPNALSECIELYQTIPRKDGVITRYSEGGNFHADNYYKSWTHRDQQLEGIPKDYWCCPIGFYDRQFFEWMGGLDCAFEHVNMNAHDLAIRLQKHGGQMHLSPSCVMVASFENHLDFHRPLDYAHQLNDAPLFAKIYTQPCPDRIRINFDNWRTSEAIWNRRFKVN